MEPLRVWMTIQRDGEEDPSRVPYAARRVVTMMQPANVRDGDDRADSGDGPGDRGVLCEPEVRAKVLIVRRVLGEDSSQPELGEHDDVVQAFPPDKPNDAFRVTVLPRRARRRTHFANTHAIDRRRNGREGAVAIVHEEPRGRVGGKCFAELLGRPCRGRVRRHGDVHEATSLKRQDYEHEQ
jgi:hypothetical protein